MQPWLPRSSEPTSESSGPAAKIDSGAEPVASDLRLLRLVGAASSGRERSTVVFEHPRLLVPGAIEGLRHVVDKDASARSAIPNAVQAVAVVEELRARIEDDPSDYPVGFGPIESLWRQQELGEVSMARAEELARDPDVARSLAPFYVDALLKHAATLSAEGDWRRAVALQRLLLAAGDSPDPWSCPETVRTRIVLGWLVVADLALMQMPDARILRSAREAGEQLVERARSAAEPATVAETLYRLGILHLDPYTAGRSREGLEASLRAWKQRIVDELGDEVAKLPVDVWRMPPARDALRAAEHYLREAARGSLGRRRGMTLSALGAALLYLEVTGESVDRREIVEVHREAVELLDRDHDALLRMQALATLEQLGEPSDRQTSQPPAPPPVDELLRRHGSINASQIVDLVSHGLDSADPRRALDLVREARPLVRRQGEEAVARSLDSELRLIAQAHGRAVPLRRPPGGITAAAAELEQRAREEQWSSSSAVATLIALATASVGWNEPEGGLRLLDRASQTGGPLVEDHAEAL